MLPENTIKIFTKHKLDRSIHIELITTDDEGDKQTYTGFRTIEKIHYREETMLCHKHYFLLRSVTEHGN